eukprot:277860-Chlamydomonas_euryale.AAC.1
MHQANRRGPAWPWDVCCGGRVVRGEGQPCTRQIGRGGCTPPGSKTLTDVGHLELAGRYLSQLSTN